MEMENKFDIVQRPKHYNKAGRKECIDEMVDIFGQTLTTIWAIMTAYKYQYRIGAKDAVEQELGKIKWYEDYAIDHMTGPITKGAVAIYYRAVHNMKGDK